MKLKFNKILFLFLATISLMQNLNSFRSTLATVKQTVHQLQILITPISIQSVSSHFPLWNFIKEPKELIEFLRLTQLQPEPLYLEQTK